MFRKLTVFSLLIALLLGVGSFRPQVVAQDSDTGITVEFTPYEGNPVLPKGEAGAWDAGFTFMGNVLFEDGVFHMFYVGGEDDFNLSDLALGYASSEDGLHWTKYEGNPVLPLDDTSALPSVFSAVPILEGDTWVLFVTAHLGQAHPATSIWRATAQEPTGPWQVHDPPILEGSEAWDIVLGPESIVSTDEGYVLYYWGVQSAAVIGVGRATSPDGVTWTKYNDPATDTAWNFKESDPVLVAGEYGRWDHAFIASGDVWLGAHGWEMFYTAGPDYTSAWGVGYATSEDGITWVRHGDSPILMLEDGRTVWASSVVVVDDTYYLYYSPFVDVGPIEGDLGHYPEIYVATGTITRGEVED